MRQSLTQKEAAEARRVVLDPAAGNGIFLCTGESFREGTQAVPRQGIFRFQARLRGPQLVPGNVLLAYDPTNLMPFMHVSCDGQGRLWMGKATGEGWAEFTVPYSLEMEWAEVTIHYGAGGRPDSIQVGEAPPFLGHDGSPLAVEAGRYCLGCSPRVGGASASCRGVELRGWSFEEIREELHEEARRVLIRRHGNLGDVLRCAPAVRALRRQYPRAHLAFSTAPAYQEVVARTCHVDAEVPDGVDPFAYDRVLNLDDAYEKSPQRREKHAVDLLAERAGIELGDRLVEWPVTEGEREWARSLLGSLGVREDDQLIGLGLRPRADSPERAWFEERWQALAQAALAAGYKVACFGGPGEEPLPVPGALDLVGKTTLPQAAALLQQCAVLVTVDSGLLHLAAAVGTPVVALFGCTDPRVVTPQQRDVQAMVAATSPPCAPCFAACREDRQCMRAITVQRVWDQVRDRLEAQAQSRVSIIIPVFDGVEYLRECLEALEAQTDYPHYEVILVDDGSQLPETREYLAGLPYRVIYNDENGGFAYASNQGALASHGEFLCFLNSDTIPEPGWLTALVNEIHQPGAGAVGARLIYPESETIQHAGLWPNEHGHFRHLFQGAPGDTPGAVESRVVPAVTGACLLVRRQGFFALGGFDETYRHSCEDTDLCLKLWTTGRQVRCCGPARLYHWEAKSSDDSEALAEKRRSAEEQLKWRWGYFLRHPEVFPLDRPRVLVSRFASRGDVLLTAPVLRALKQRNPDCILTVQTGAGTAALLAGNPDVDHVVTSAAHRREGYDLVLDLNGAYENSPDRGDTHLVDLLARRAGVAVSSRAPRLFLTEEERAFAREFLSALGAWGQPVVGIAPRSHQREYICWFEDCWREVALSLTEQGYPVVVFGGAGETPLRVPEAIQPIDQLTFRQVAAVISHCALLLSVDTGTMHLAAALGTPVLGLFGATLPGLILPPEGNWAALEAEGLDCRPCFDRECEAKDCMRALPPDFVVRMARSVLAGAPDPPPPAGVVLSTGHAWRAPSRPLPYTEPSGGPAGPWTLRAPPDRPTQENRSRETGPMSRGSLPPGARDQMVSWGGAADVGS